MSKIEPTHWMDDQGRVATAEFMRSPRAHSDHQAIFTIPCVKRKGKVVPISEISPASNTDDHDHLFIKISLEQAKVGDQAYDEGNKMWFRIGSTSQLTGVQHMQMPCRRLAPSKDIIKQTFDYLLNLAESDLEGHGCSTTPIYKGALHKVEAAKLVIKYLKNKLHKL